MTATEMHRALQREAYERGHEEAVRVERERADARCATALQAVARAAGHLGEIATEFAQDRERDLQGLAIAVARHIVQHELTIDPLRVGELVRRALDLLPLDHTIEVRLNPEDLHTLGPSLEGLRPEGRQVSVQWVGDPSVERGGFVAETPHRIVDGRADVALRALYERFDHD
jgi:flagellar biosynthesis/type III secretory pathway protein FliH